MTRRVPSTDAAEVSSVAIVDDEPLARSGMRTLVGDVPGFRVVGDAGSGSEALALVHRTRPDILLLDVQMPGMDGFAVLRSLGSAVQPAVVFVTAYDTFALRAFDVHAVDYVLKPYTDARLREALLVARHSYGTRLHAERAARLGALLDAVHAERKVLRDEIVRSSIAVRGRGRTDFINPADIVWIEADGSYARLHTTRASILHRETLDALAQQLDGNSFVRVHRSALIAARAVRQIVRRPDGVREAVLSSGARVRVSRSGWQSLRAAMDASAL